MNYSKWPEGYFLATNLELDPLNPRLAESGRDLSFRDIAALLIEHEKIYELAKSIVDNGYYPGEALYAINAKNTKKKIVVEGNRRLAALRLLISPELAPERHVKRFRALSYEINIDTIKEVRTIVAPSRESLYPIMMARHTKSEIEPWDSLMKAKFYQNLMHTGYSISEIAQKYNIVPNKIIDAIRDSTMYQIACSLEYTPEIGSIVLNPRKFPITTLRRLYKNPTICDFLGYTFDDNNELKGTTSIDEFKKGFKKIVVDLANKDIKPKDVYSTVEIKEYLKDNFSKDEIPNTRKRGTFKLDDFLKDKGATKPVIKNKSVKTKVTASKGVKVFPTNIKCTTNDQRIKDIFKELKALNLKSHPNAIIILLRSLLEMSLYHYLNKLGYIKGIRDNENAKREQKAKRVGNVQQKIPKDWAPTLRDMLHYVVYNDECTIVPDPLLIKSLKSFLSTAGLVSIDSMHQFVHNKHFVPDEDTIKKLCGQPLLGLFEIILIEPTTE